jgi:hypothetical protein
MLSPVADFGAQVSYFEALRVVDIDIHTGSIQVGLIRDIKK